MFVPNKFHKRTGSEISAEDVRILGNLDKAKPADIANLLSHVKPNQNGVTLDEYIQNTINQAQARTPPPVNASASATQPESATAPQAQASTTDPSQASDSNTKEKVKEVVGAAVDKGAEIANTVINKGKEVIKPLTDENKTLADASALLNQNLAPTEEEKKQEQTRIKAEEEERRRQEADSKKSLAERFMDAKDKKLFAVEEFGKIQKNLSGLKEGLAMAMDFDFGDMFGSFGGTLKGLLGTLSGFIDSALSSMTKFASNLMPSAQAEESTAPAIVPPTEQQTTQPPATTQPETKPAPATAPAGSAEAKPKLEDRDKINGTFNPNATGETARARTEKELANGKKEVTYDTPEAEKPDPNAAPAPVATVAMKP